MISLIIISSAKVQLGADSDFCQEKIINSNEKS